MDGDDDEDDDKSIFWDYKRVRKFLKRSRPQADRYRDPAYCAEHGLLPFPEPFRIGVGGKLLFLKSEIFDYAMSQRLLAPRPPTGSE
jgi:hypothetical protein